MAAPDDGRMDIADTVTIGNAISAAISPALLDGSVGLSLVHVENFSNQSNVIKFRKSGSLIAEVVAEGAVYVASDANSDINDTSVSCTSQKMAVASPISYEAVRFGAGAASTARVAAEQGAAIAREIDDDLIALFDGLTNVATATTTMSIDCFIDGIYNINAAPAPVGAKVALLHYKQVMELQKVLAATGAAAMSNTQFLELLNSAPKANGFVGNFLGVDVYQQSGMSTTGGDHQGAMWNRDYCFAAGFGGSIETEIMKTGMGVASQVPGFSWVVLSHLFYKIVEWNDTCGCEIRSDT
jgi:hypothetical protein